MKKLFTRTITLCLLLAMSVGCLSGCGLGGSAPDLTGTEKAKLLLANQRLDSSVLAGSLNMLTNSDGSLNASLVLPNDDLYATLGGISIQILEKLGTCNKKGDTYEWKAFDDYCNIDSFFDSYMVAIEASVEQATAMIDHLKTDVNVVDKWVGYKDEPIAYMLSVEGSTDTLYEKLEDGYRISNVPPIPRQRTYMNYSNLAKLLTEDLKTFMNPWFMFLGKDMNSPLIWVSK